MDSSYPDTATSQDFQRIDLAALMARHKPALAKRLPRFAVSALGKLVHLAEINDFLEAHWQDEPIEFLHNTIAMLDMRLSMVHQERMDAVMDNRPVIVGNHPLGGPESLLLANHAASTYPDLKIISQEIMLSIKPLAPMLVPVPKNNAKAEASELFKAFRSDDPLMLFPAGFCSRPLSFGAIYDFQWFKTFVKVARVYNRPVVPLYIDGSNSKKFYRWYKLRTSLRLKTTVESILLVDEMFRQKGNTLVVTVGNPIAPEALSKEVSDQEWADRIRQYVYQLSLDAEAVFDPNLAATLPLT